MALGSAREGRNEADRDGHRVSRIVHQASPPLTFGLKAPKPAYIIFLGRHRAGQNSATGLPDEMKTHTICQPELQAGPKSAPHKCHATAIGGAAASPDPMPWEEKDESADRA